MKALYDAGYVENQTVTGVLTKLATVTKVADRPINSRDLEITLGILNMTVLYNKKYKNFKATNEKARKSFIKTSSNLLDPLNAKTWQSLEKVKITL